ncbi:CopG family transcriptional regulator [Nocardia sp. CY41]|uniref:ribbon-helix-helix domain-containing protein n=1 Tax=Nocardia sp. CY41 TaxID=2608686 RepID=UPI0013583A9E|nr:CopG family transcriptional regulator [Nocardia sp. CY41]
MTKQQHYLAPTPEQVDALMDATDLIWDDVPEDEAPPVLTEDEASKVMVVRSVRLPVDLDKRINAEADARGVTRSDLLRDWASIQLAELSEDQPISRADALRALASIPPRRTA